MSFGFVGKDFYEGAKKVTQEFRQDALTAMTLYRCVCEEIDKENPIFMHWKDTVGADELRNQCHAMASKVRFIWSLYSDGSMSQIDFHGTFVPEALKEYDFTTAAINKAPELKKSGKNLSANAKAIASRCDVTTEGIPDWRR
jgi:hypothetical protein